MSEARRSFAIRFLAFEKKQGGRAFEGLHFFKKISQPVLGIRTILVDWNMYFCKCFKASKVFFLFFFSVFLLRKYQGGPWADAIFLSNWKKNEKRAHVVWFEQTRFCKWNSLECGVVFDWKQKEAEAEVGFAEELSKLEVVFVEKTKQLHQRVKRAANSPDMELLMELSRFQLPMPLGQKLKHPPKTTKEQTPTWENFSDPLPY